MNIYVCILIVYMSIFIYIYIYLNVGFGQNVLSMMWALSITKKNMIFSPVNIILCENDKCCCKYF